MTRTFENTSRDLLEKRYGKGSLVKATRVMVTTNSEWNWGEESRGTDWCWKVKLRRKVRACCGQRYTYGCFNAGPRRVLLQGKTFFLRMSDIFRDFYWYLRYFGAELQLKESRCFGFPTHTSI
jgi:hypothetical protein